MENLRPTRAIINLDNVEHNFREIKRITKPDVKICAIVKADGYGHGAIETAKMFLSCGAYYLAVAFLDEAIELREKGIRAPILILGFTPEHQFDKIVKYDITQTVYNYKSCEYLSEIAKKLGRKVKVHIKVDTGMSRIGFDADDFSIAEITKIFDLDGLEIEGIFTHFAKADEKDKSFTELQFQKFTSIINSLEKHGFNIPLKHAANSAAIIDLPYTHLDMIRPGIILYGLYPSDEVNKSKIELKPALSLKTMVSHVKTLPKGRFISYGGIYETKRTSLIATLPIGYADGYSRLLSSKAQVLINGQRAPAVGRICMDQCMVDVTDISGDINPGDEAILIGNMGNEAIIADELAKMMGTINYEVICGISQCIPRIYIKHGDIIKVN